MADTVTNGGFDTGTLSGFAVFTTPNGSNGGGGLPNVVSFDTTGTGASYAAHFNVGELTFDSKPQGGGLTQTITINTGGAYTLSENFASQSVPLYGNEDAGTFSLLLNGGIVASDSLGSIAVGAIERGSLTDTMYLAPGSYTFQTEITRIYQTGGQGDTPDQYIDNLAITQATTVTPEPSSVILLGTGILSFAGAMRRRFI